MTATFTWWMRRRAAGTAVAAAAAAVVVTAVTGCSIGTGTTGTTGTVVAVPASSSPPVTSNVTPGLPVVLWFGPHAVAATLADTPASRELAARLPLTLELSDTWGQAKSGRLPHPIPVEGAVRTVKPIPGGIYYWPATAALAVYYDDLGQSVPSPGLIRLGVIDTALDVIAHTGRQVTVRIDRVGETRS
ncbi:cyclophilin-like fold protein [Nonomuraea sp. NPDC049158]|uniref:cyclophilin-like fold protein n=1 Tax=Nonomuraea sp. NPDC049158 TaxID=3155649 RepID=UPI0033E278EB